MKKLPDYRFCTRTVTLYHRLPGKTFAAERKVYKGAFLDWSETRRETAAGTEYEADFLLLLPSGVKGRLIYEEPRVYDALSQEARKGRFTLAPGDKIARGEGPEIESAAQWAAFTGKQGGALVKETAERFLEDAVLHLEAGSGQRLGRSSLPRPKKGLQW